MTQVGAPVYENNDGVYTTFHPARHLRLSRHPEAGRPTLGLRHLVPDRDHPPRCSRCRLRARSCAVGCSVQIGLTSVSRVSALPLDRVMAMSEGSRRLATRLSPALWAQDLNKGVARRRIGTPPPPGPPSGAVGTTHGKRVGHG